MISPFTYDETEWEEFEKRGFPVKEVKALWRIYLIRMVCKPNKKWCSHQEKNISAVLL
jgi:hypothetical protein